MSFLKVSSGYKPGALVALVVFLLTTGAAVAELPRLEVVVGIETVPVEGQAPEAFECAVIVRDLTTLSVLFAPRLFVTVGESGAAKSLDPETGLQYDTSCSVDDGAATAEFSVEVRGRPEEDSDLVLLSRHSGVVRLVK